MREGLSGNHQNIGCEQLLKSSRKPDLNEFIIMNH